MHILKTRSKLFDVRQSRNHIFISSLFLCKIQTFHYSVQIVIVTNDERSFTWIFHHIMLFINFWIQHDLIPFKKKLICIPFNVPNFGHGLCPILKLSHFSMTSLKGMLRYNLMLNRGFESPKLRFKMEIDYKGGRGVLHTISLTHKIS